MEDRPRRNLVDYMISRGAACRASVLDALSLWIEDRCHAQDLGSEEAVEMRRILLRLKDGMVETAEERSRFLVNQLLGLLARVREVSP